MKSITSKFLACLILFTILLLFYLFFLFHSLVDAHLQDVTKRQVSMALQFDLSIRKYAAKHIRPLMYELVGEEEFIPETMSTSFIARSIFDDVRKEFPDYIIKFSSDNPRNPANLAGPEELKIIQKFNQDPSLQQWEGVIAIDGRTFVAKFSARRMKPSCLRCHGDPKDAPKALIEKYGNTAGFHRPLGEVIGLDTVAIPISKVTEKMYAESFTPFVPIVAGVIFFFLATALAMRFLIINRVKRIAGHFHHASLQEDHAVIKPIEVSGRDEISLLSNSFNALTGKLKDYYGSLENQVTSRTKALAEKNLQLEQEIKDHRQTEIALKETEATIGSIFRVAPTGIGMVIDRIIHQANPRLCDMLGYTTDQLLGQSAKMLYPTMEEYEKVGREKYEQIKQHGTGTIETKWVRNDGEVLDILLSSTPLDVDDWSAGVTFTALDFTDLKRTERRQKQLEERLARSQKMEALGLLAGGVAHDLNNVLSGIVSYPDLLLMDLPEKSPIREAISTIQESGKKAAAIVEDLLTLARRGVTHREVLNLNDIIRDCLHSPEWDSFILSYGSIKIKPVLNEKLLNIRGSAIHLKKAFMNLLTNAAEALADGGCVNISTENVYVDRPIEGYDHVREGDFVVLTVSDNGVGIDPKDLKRIFEPFYTKKVMGRSGTGLGMSVVWGTVQDHHGYIHVESQVDRGTVFQLYFPVTREKKEKGKGSTPVAEYTGAGQTILVVDDIEEQRRIAAEMLTALGYDVTVATCGEEAVELLRVKETDLVILDMIMDPGIDGLDTYKMIAELHPGQKAIIASGFSETERVKRARQLGAQVYLKKPYTLENIGMAVRDELARQQKSD